MSVSEDALKKLGAAHKKDVVLQLCKICTASSRPDGFGVALA
uniref:Uncharacterized protein n=1 Tax=Peronospora matthiolae TaxID=2874970 RepID=A0AAV1U8L6_9STRA